MDFYQSEERFRWNVYIRVYKYLNSMKPFSRFEVLKMLYAFSIFIIYFLLWFQVDLMFDTEVNQCLLNDASNFTQEFHSNNINLQMYYKQYNNETTHNQSRISNQILDFETIRIKEMLNLRNKSEILYKIKIGIDFIYNILKLILPKIFTQDEYTVRNYIYSSYNKSENQEFANISIPFNHYCIKKSLSLSTITGSNEIILMILIRMGIKNGQLYDEESQTILLLENYRVEKPIKDEIISFCMNILVTLIFQLLLSLICGEIYNLFLRFYYKQTLIFKGSKLGLILNIIFLLIVCGFTIPIVKSVLSIISIKVFNILIIEGILINFVVHFLFQSRQRRFFTFISYILIVSGCIAYISKYPASEHSLMMGCQIWVLLTLMLHNSFDGEYYFWKGKYEMSLFLEENPQLLSIFDVRTLQTNNIILDLHNFIPIPYLVLGNSRREINDSALFLQRNYNNVFHIEEESEDQTINQQINTNEFIQNNEGKYNKNGNNIRGKSIKNDEDYKKRLSNENLLISESSLNQGEVNNSKICLESKTKKTKSDWNIDMQKNKKTHETSNNEIISASRESNLQLEEQKHIKPLNGFENFKNFQNFENCENFENSKNPENLETLGKTSKIENTNYLGTLEEEKEFLISSNSKRDFDYSTNDNPGKLLPHKNDLNLNFNSNDKESHKENEDIVVNKKRNKNSMEILSDLFTTFINDEAQIKKFTKSKNPENDDDDEQDEDGNDDDNDDEEEDDIGSNQSNKKEGKEVEEKKIRK